MITNPFEMASQFLGRKEFAGERDNPLILGMLQLDDSWPEHDEIPWCSAFVNFICFCCKLPRSKSLGARSWLSIGQPVLLDAAKKGFDIVIFERGIGGHVAFFDSVNDKSVFVLGGNQSDQVSYASFPRTRVMGVRRLE